ncbi:MAG: YitT family protein [Caldisericia bacterium]|nr:YitT family protein [Caldisericia bacterium]
MNDTITQTEVPRIRANFLGVILGTFVDAFGYSLFLIPNKLTLGGINGIAIIIYYLIEAKYPVGVIYLVLNIPIFIWAFFRLQKRVILTTFISVVANSLAIDFFSKYVIPSLDIHPDLLISVLYGAVLSGFGIGMLYRSYGSLGGTDMLAQIVKTYTNASFGQIVISLDGIVILSSALIFKDADLALLPLLGIIVVGKMIDLVQEGLSSSKAALVVTSKDEEIKDFIIKEMDRGVTMLEGKGGYTKSGKTILICAFSRRQYSTFKKQVMSFDPKAFVMIGSLDEVVGEGFERKRD